MIYEDILHFTPRALDNSVTPPAEIARAVLNAALTRAPRESLADLNSAIEKVEEVRPSPMYDREAAFSRQPGREIKEVV
jgi:hypothetical protein